MNPDGLLKELNIVNRMASAVILSFFNQRYLTYVYTILTFYLQR